MRVSWFLVLSTHARKKAAEEQKTLLHNPTIFACTLLSLQADGLEEKEKAEELQKQEDWKSQLEEEVTPKLVRRLQCISFGVGFAI